MRVVITRPASDAPAWVDAVQAAGHQVLKLPLIEVGPTAQTHALQQAWLQWHEWQAVMFVSAQAVRYFFEARPMSASAGLNSASPRTGPRCWATGPGTRKALLQAGVPEGCIDSPAADASQFDSEALWARVAPGVQAGKPVLIVRGEDVSAGAQPGGSTVGSGREWLAQQLQAAGVNAHFVVAYERRLPAWSDPQRSQAQQAASDGSVWCLSSSQAVDHLAQLLPAQHWREARCIATHTRIVESAQRLGFGTIHLCRPQVADVLASLESLA